MFVPDESRVESQIVRKAVGQQAITVIPTIRKYYVELSAPTFDDPASDWERLIVELESRFGLRNLSIDHAALRTLSSALRRGRWQVTISVWDQKEIIRVEPGYVERAYGLAVDVGSTTVAGHLCDLASGEIVATEAMMNPQVEFGEDIIARISYAQQPGGLDALNRAIMNGLDEIARNVTLQVGLLPEDIQEAVLVGNTVMHHILLGLDIAQLGMAPYTPAIRHSVNVKARDLGLAILPSANVHLLPIEAGYVGADNVAVLIAEEPYNHDDVRLIIDIGTNGELILGNRKHLLSTSCATGPAFEGASIKFGMRATRRAIDKVRIDPQTLEVRFSVIGCPKWNTQQRAEEVQARGICGSGIIDALAEMLTAGIIDKRGHFDKSLASSRLRTGTDGKPEFVIALREETSIDQDITVTTEDVVAIQLAKASMYAGAQMLLRRYGVEKPDKVILAGGFGAVIDRQRALTIGLFPDCDLNRVYAVGNAAGDGARMALLNKEKRAEAERVASQVEYVELTIEPSFTEAFVAATRFNGAKKK
ncbi:ASKHA domain-containing protein [Paradesulfitobacterium aromaticivorans]